MLLRLRRELKRFLFAPTSLPKEVLLPLGPRGMRSPPREAKTREPTLAAPPARWSAVSAATCKWTSAREADLPMASLKGPVTRTVPGSSKSSNLT